MLLRLVPTSWNAAMAATAISAAIRPYSMAVAPSWFFISFVGPDLKWPDATLRLSPFYYYGTPLLHGLQLTDIALVVVVAAVALALGVLRFARKDIAI